MNEQSSLKLLWEVPLGFEILVFGWTLREETSYRQFLSASIELRYQKYKSLRTV